MSFHYREGTHQTRTVHDIGSEAHSRRQLFGVNMANWKNLPDTDSHDLAPSPGDVSDLATDNITVNAPAAAAAEAAADVTLHHDYLSGDRDVFLVEENERLCRQMQQQERRHQQKIQQQALQIKQQEQTIEQLKQQIKNIQKQQNDNAHHSL